MTAAGTREARRRRKATMVRLARAASSTVRVWVPDDTDHGHVGALVMLEASAHRQRRLRHPRRPFDAAAGLAAMRTAGRATQRGTARSRGPRGSLALLVEAAERLRTEQAQSGQPAAELLARLVEAAQRLRARADSLTVLVATLAQIVLRALGAADTDHDAARTFRLVDRLAQGLPPPVARDALVTAVLTAAPPAPRRASAAA